MSQKFYMQQNVFRLTTNQFSIKNQLGQDAYFVDSELFSLSQKHHLLNHQRQRLYSVERKFFTFLPTYYVKDHSSTLLTIVQECSCMGQELTITGTKNWKVIGDYTAHDFQIIDNGQIIAVIRKAWFTWGESFEIDVQFGQAELVITTVIAIHQAMQGRSSHF
ncbi:Conserved_hypothetical protein [Hexamita inflata]|uniref:LURP-one-related family protein n=1 Tax=Hexamita inflata TaxID=28002 RepID=A0AA86RE56_9EUKA|nr:Conserved hypothetical protein [Hexamita inflata]